MPEMKPIELPLTLVAPVQLKKQAIDLTCGLFFPHRTNLPVGLAVDWDGTTHLIHLGGAYAFKEAAIEIGHGIKGLILNNIEFRADVTSRYESGHVWDPLGAIVLRDGQLSILCQRLGDQYHDDPYPVPLGTGYPAGVPEEACGFTRWSIAVKDGDQIKVIESFEAVPRD
jgi:hypothetical protein